MAGNHVIESELMKKEYGNVPFSQDIILKWNHIVIFISLSLVNTRITILDCIDVILDPQCIVSQEDFQHKFRSVGLEVLYKKYLF